jgi:hypothetical protein
MSEKTESFDAFLSHWINERIQKLGEVDPVDREDIIEKKAAELVALSRDFTGFHAKLDEVALPYGRRQRICAPSLSVSRCPGLYDTPDCA